MQIGTSGPRATYYVYLPLRAIKICSVVFGVTCNVQAFCHKQDSLTRNAAAFVDSSLLKAPMEKWTKSTL